ncbi:NUDIX domain-containing protein [Falsiroseomonas oryzae]|uniref:NUDIX domain-containing protein n=1 Tax=Falsiroseomonas oryzae TaxID=2766473 RepID=UPI0022EB9787|nr:NUDIX domain-containing protein [Roseomonas sp. MO-31]
MSASLPRHRLAPPIPPAEGLAVEADEIVYANRFAMQRVRFRYARFDGSLSGLLTWELWRRGRGVLMLPYDPASDRVALIEQFRLPAHAAGLPGIQTECPAGLLEPGEDPALAGIRELREEAGLDAKAVARIGAFLLMPGGCDEVVHFFCAHVDLSGEGTGTHGLDSEHEETRVVVLPAEDAFRMVAENRLDGAPAALALLWLQLNRARLRAEWTQR